ncbi:MAG: creatininase family protein [Proteobacteria bacterium]|nr:creatininase family protein [Pseudomonadota bacterium]
MLLQLSTWPEVEKHLERESGIIIPIGSTEQHGPNGLIGTDAICPETIARGVGEESGALVAPTLNVGMAQHHMAFAGSMTLRPSTLIAVIKDVVDSLARHGFDRFYFLNGHGGNIATVSSAFSEIHAERSLRPGGAIGAPVRCKIANWWMGPKVRGLAKKLFGNAEGSHATPSEVSLSFYAHPEAVKSAEMSPRIAPKGGFHGAEDFRRRFPDGRIGSDPSLASVAAGEQLYLAALGEIAADYKAFLAAD